MFNTLFLLAQEQQMAYDYFRKGEYEKSASIYKTLYEQNNFNSNYLTRLIDCYQQLENFDTAQELIENHIKKQPRQTHFLVELGYNYEIQHRQEKAETYYKKALKSIDKKGVSGYSIGKTFQDNHLLDYALQAYKFVMDKNPNANYNYQIAQIYGEKGDIQSMFDTYLNAIEKDEKHLNSVKRYVGKYITEDSENEYNLLFKKAILKRLQTDQKNAWNQLLSWQFIHQKQYGKAFIQEKALYKRSLESMTDIISLGEIAFDNKDYRAYTKYF